MDKRKDEPTNAWTDGWTVRLYYAPNFIWGHKKFNLPNIKSTLLVSSIWDSGFTGIETV